jgi:hypothetical protein
MRQAKLILYFFLSFALLIGFGGCAKSAGDKLVSQNKGLAHFSFECPAEYLRFPYPNVDKGNDFITLTAYRKSKSVPIGSQIYIEVWKAGSNFYKCLNAEEYMQADLNFLWGGTYQVKITDYYSFTVANVPAKGWEFSYMTRPIPYPGVNRSVYFDCNNLIWGISMHSDVTNAEADKADFQHLLESFKILT